MRCVDSLTGDALALGTVSLLELFLVFEGGKGIDEVGDATGLQLLQELGVADVALGAKAGNAQRQRLLGLCSTCLGPQPSLKEFPSKNAAQL